MKGFRTSCSFSSPELSLSQGSSTPRGRSPDRRPSSPISPATPTASRSRTPGSIALDDKGVTFKWKDYPHPRPRPAQDHDARGRRVHPPLPPPRAAERLPPHPPLRLPRRPRTRRNHRAPAGPDRGLQRDRSASPRNRRKRAPRPPPNPPRRSRHARICPCCGGRMRIIETFARGARPRSFTAESAGIDSS